MMWHYYFQQREKLHSYRAVKVFLVPLKHSVRLLWVILICLINMSPGLKYPGHRQRGVSENSFKDRQLGEPLHWRKKISSSWGRSLSPSEKHKSIYPNTMTDKSWSRSSFISLYSLTVLPQPQKHNCQQLGCKRFIYVINIQRTNTVTLWQISPSLNYLGVRWVKWHQLIVSNFTISTSLSLFLSLSLSLPVVVAGCAGLKKWKKPYCTIMLHSIFYRQGKIP